MKQAQTHRRVVTLVTVPSDEQLVENTLFFDTIRVGFPNAEIKVSVNGDNSEETKNIVSKRCDDIHAEYDELSYQYHHGAWIHHEVVQASNRGSEGLVIVDPDTIWFDDCQGFDFPTLIAGRFVPVMWNEFAMAISYERLHTSFLWVRSCRELMDAIDTSYPPAKMPSGEYCPVNPFMPRVMFHQGFPMFWDSCSTLFNMVGGSIFTENELDRYAHVNSTAFHDIMMERVEDKEALANQHQQAHERNFDYFRQFWKAEDMYYGKQHIKAIELVTKRQQAIQQINQQHAAAAGNPPFRSPRRGNMTP